MFKHILLPTDGSPLSEVAVKKGMQFAKSIGARVTGLYVIAPFRFLWRSDETVTPRPWVKSEEGGAKEQYEKDSQMQAQSYLSVISNAAKEQGVICDCVSETNAHPSAAIVEAAEKRGCDLIMMASHGRRGLQAVLIGSETTKVLTHTKIPVLVLR
jgi:nucleotide-binding universal stress UspA family protein